MLSQYPFLIALFLGCGLGLINLQVLANATVDLSESTGTDLLPAAPSGPPCDTAITGTPLWPTCGAVPPIQSSPFGPRQKASENSRYDWHRGVDIPLPFGSPVYAVEEGLVRIAGTDPSYSDPLVQLRHGTGPPYWYSNYMHMSSVLVTPGEQVGAGDLLGYSGRSASGFEHLHFEIRDGCLYQECNRNPWGYLPYTDTLPATPSFLGANRGDGNTLILLEGETPAGELDLDGIEVLWGSDDVTLSFNQINASLTHDDPGYPTTLDTPLIHLANDMNVCLFPVSFNAGSPTARYHFAFLGLDPTATGGTAALRDLRQSGPAHPLTLPASPLTLAPATQSRQVFPGGTLVFTHTLRNISTQSLTLSLQAQSAQNNSVSLQPTTLTLAPGTSTFITLTVTSSSAFPPGIGDCLLTRVQHSDGTELIALDIVTTFCYDFDASGWVDRDDIEMVSRHWRQRIGDPSWRARFDLDGDGRISVVDMMHIAARQGYTCGQDLWTWNRTVVTDPAARADFFAFARTHAISTVYLESEWLLNYDQTSLADFITTADTEGVAVELLFGYAPWALTPNHMSAIALAQTAVTFAQELKGPKPVGLHFDVEPYTLPEWDADQNGTANQFLDLLEALAAVTQGTGLRLTVDIPFWYDNRQVTRAGQTRPLSEWVIDRVDRVVMMDYRDHADPPDGIIDHATEELAYAKRVGKQVVIGVETNCGLSPEKITFCEEGVGAMESAFNRVRGTYFANPAFAGLAVHDYDGYRALGP